MADSTHILKLKATLDTSEVKSKLDQLRQVQQQALGNNQKSENAPSQGVGGNLTLLTSTLNRLNTSMMQMQRVLSQLTVGTKIQLSSLPQQTLFNYQKSGNTQTQSVGNLTLLTSTLSRLNASMMQIQRMLSQLTVGTKMHQLSSLSQQVLVNYQKSGNTQTQTQSVGENFTLLTSTLNRLNTSMMQMQRTFSQLIVGNKIQQLSSSVSLLPPMALTPKTLTLILTLNKAANIIEGFINKKVAKDILDFAREGRLDGLLNLYESTSTDWATRYFQTKLTPASTGMKFDAWKNWMSKKDVQKQFELQFVNPELNEKLNEKLNKRNIAINNFQMLKPIAGLVLQQGTSMIGDYARLNGDDTMAFAASSIGKIGGYAMMGSAAGPYGAVVGAAYGAIETLFDYFTENAKEALKELEDWNRNIERSQTFKKTYDEAKEIRTLNTKISKAVKTDDVKSLQAMANQIQKNIDLNSKFLEGQREGAEYGETAENIMDIFNEQEKRISLLEHIKSLIDQINDKKKKEAEILKQINERNKKEAEIKAEIEKKNLENYRKQSTILKQSYKWEEEANRNSADITLGTYDYNTLGDKYNKYREKYLDFKSLYETNLDKAESATTSESASQFLDIASRMKDAMNFNRSQMDLFGGSQLEMLNNLLSKIKAPDMTNVTSLASQGLMTYGKDEQLVDLQVDYMKQQLDVQKQIKDKMREHVEFE